MWCWRETAKCKESLSIELNQELHKHFLFQINKASGVTFRHETCVISFFFFFSENKSVMLQDSNFFKRDNHLEY